MVEFIIGKTISIPTLFWIVIGVSAVMFEVGFTLGTRKILTENGGRKNNIRVFRNERML
jgi:hypothetical protein